MFDRILIGGFFLRRKLEVEERRKEDQDNNPSFSEFSLFRGFFVREAVFRCIS